MTYKLKLILYLKKSTKKSVLSKRQKCTEPDMTTTTSATLTETTTTPTCQTETTQIEKLAVDDNASSLPSFVEESQCEPMEKCMTAVSIEENRAVYFADSIDTNEPELFTFNESFDVNLLNLKNRHRNHHHHHNNASTTTISDLYNNSVDLLNNLNRLYNNLEQNCDDVLSLSFDSEFQRTDVITKMEEATNELTIMVNNGDEEEDDNNSEFVDMDSSTSDELFNPSEISSPIEKSFRKTTTTTSTRSPRNRKLIFNRTIAKLDLQLVDMLKTKRFRSKMERLNHTRNFYSRRNRTTGGEVVEATPRRGVKLGYKPSFKVEKLLNDSRGMKKYLIDYDCLMHTQLGSGKKLENETLKCASSLSISNGNDEEKVDMALPYSNRCSSGYLSDC